MPPRALIIVADQFRDEELFEPLAAFEEVGMVVDIASLACGPLHGMMGGSIEAHQTVYDVDVQAYQLLMIPGGEGTAQLRASETVLEIVRAFDESKRIISAICWAPTILALAGVLENRTAVSFHIPDDGIDLCKMSHEILIHCGATLGEEHVVKDGHIITADGPRYATAFAEKVLNALYDRT